MLARSWTGQTVRNCTLCKSFDIALYSGTVIQTVLGFPVLHVARILCASYCTKGAHTHIMLTLRTDGRYNTVVFTLDKRASTASRGPLSPLDRKLADPLGLNSRKMTELARIVYTAFFLDRKNVVKTRDVWGRVSSRRKKGAQDKKRIREQHVDSSPHP